MAPDEMRGAIARIRRMFEELLVGRANVVELAKKDCSEEMLEPDDEDLALLKTREK